MSKPLRQKAISNCWSRGPVASQEDLQRALGKRGFKVGQATLSRISTTFIWSRPEPAMRARRMTLGPSRHCRLFQD